ncbi:MAG: GGDEF domain-containing protein [Bacillaceae bacterium]|nr:GGDEF domain-containing protein [Bacillaceae bacterium]
MGYSGRFFSVLVVGLFNVIRYLYYHIYMGVTFELSFFVLTTIFLLVGWWCGLQYDRAQYFSEKDPLTNVYNRRTVIAKFNKLKTSCLKKNTKLGIIIVDLDNFKQVNDTYGHQTGDKLLTHIAQILVKIAKKQDVIARWGGDEFILLVPNVEESLQHSYIDQLKKELSQIDYVQLPGYGASVGFALLPDHGLEFNELTHKADKAMYKMKSLKIV